MATVNLSNAWLPLEETLAGLLAECTNFDTQLDEVVGELDHLRQEIQSQASALDSAQNHLSERDQRLQRSLEELAEARRRLEEQETAAIQEADAESRAMLEQLQHERDQLRDQLEAALSNQQDLVEQLRRAEDARAVREQSQSELAAELARHEDDLAARDQQLAEQEQQLAEQEQQLESLLAELNQLRDESLAPTATEPDEEAAAAFEQERLELEHELELVRSQTAELHEQFHAQEQLLEQERYEKDQEIERLRKLVKRKALPPASVPTAPATSQPNKSAAPRLKMPMPPAASSNDPVPAELPSDPVVNSVMAQFAKLQKDVQGRRARSQSQKDK